MDDALYKLDERIGIADRRDSVRTDYYRFTARHANLEAQLDWWINAFFRWTDWVIQADESNMRVVASDLEREFGTAMSNCVSVLINNIRSYAGDKKLESLYKDYKWFREAERSVQERVRSAVTEYGEHHRNIIPALLTLGRIYQEQKMYADEKDIYGRIVTICSLYEGDAHLDRVKQWCSRRIDVVDSTYLQDVS